MGLFARKPEATPEAPAPTKRGRNRVTCGALNAAIAAACAEMADCPGRRTLEALYKLTEGTEDGDIVKLSGAAPVTLTQLDAALTEAPELQPPATLVPLTRVRALIAQAEQAARVVGEGATRAELEAAVDAIGIAIREAAEGSRDAFFTLSRFYSRLDAIAEHASPDASRFLQRLLGAMRSSNSGEYGADRGRPRQPWSTM